MTVSTEETSVVPLQRMMPLHHQPFAFAAGDPAGPILRAFDLGGWIDWCPSSSDGVHERAHTPRLSSQPLLVSNIRM